MMDIELYNLEKQFLKNLNNLLFDKLDFIKETLQMVSSYTKESKFDMNYGDRYVFLYNGKFILETQNVLFNIIDDDYDFIISYKIIDELTKRQHIHNKKDFINISKTLDSEPLFNISINNYDLLNIFLIDMECLHNMLIEIKE